MANKDIFFQFKKLLYRTNAHQKKMLRFRCFFPINLHFKFDRDERLSFCPKDYSLKKKPQEIMYSFYKHEKLDYRALFIK